MTYTTTVTKSEPVIVHRQPCKPGKFIKFSVRSAAIPN